MSQIPHQPSESATPDPRRAWRRGILYFLLTAAIGVGLDMLTKYAAQTRLVEPGVEYQFIPGWLHFTYVHNFGAVFGLGQGGRWFFVLVSLAALVFVGYLFVTSSRRWWHDMALGGLLGGIFGNLYDRVVYGFVRDMIHVMPQWPNFFPWVFNIADSLLCVSVGILIFAGIFMDDRKKHAGNRTQ